MADEKLSDLDISYEDPFVSPIFNGDIHALSSAAGAGMITQQHVLTEETFNVTAAELKRRLAENKDAVINVMHGVDAIMEKVRESYYDMYEEFRKQNKFRSDMYYIERDTTATRDRIIELVKESDYNYDYCVAAVKRDGTILKALKNVESITQLQYLDLYEYAVKQNGMAIEYVPTHCQSYVITRYAVDQNPKAITKITDKTMQDLILDKRCANINTISDLQVLCDVFDTNPSLVTEERIHNICVCIEKQNRNDAWTEDADAYRDAVNTIVPVQFECAARTQSIA